MALRRYNRTPVLTKNGIDNCYGTSRSIVFVRNGIVGGLIRFTTYVTKENERLDIIAGKQYGSGRLWWVIAAASDIGFGLQMPAGTNLRIPNLEDVADIIG